MKEKGVLQLKINNIPLLLIWMEVNIFGKTVLPELFCLFILFLFIGKLCMKLILGIKEYVMVKGNM